MKAEELWNRSDLKGYYESWAFGGNPDKLADLVVRGIKTATCSAYAFYEEEDERIPEVGDYSVILDSKDNAVCIIKTTKVYICPFDEVTANHAYKEGEGDRSLKYWRKVHEEFFSQDLKSINREFDEKMKVVCEEFELVYTAAGKMN